MAIDIPNTLAILVPLGGFLSYCLFRFDRKFDRIDEKFDVIDRRFEKMEDKMDAGFERLDSKMDVGFERLDSKIEVVRTEFRGETKSVEDKIWYLHMQGKNVMDGIESEVKKARGDE